MGRPSFSSEALAEAFRHQVTRTQRRTDGTLSIEAVRVELPNRFRHLRQLAVRYARWNLCCVHLVDPRTDTLLAAIYPLDKASNADGRRRVLRSPPVPPTAATDQAPVQMAPLLSKLLANYAATGIPPAYVPKPDPTNPTQQNSP